MNQYLLTVLVENDLDEKERTALLESVTKRFGKVVKEDLWGVKDLAYPILKQSKAFYAHFEFESEPSSIAPLDRALKNNEDVIRYLLVRN